MITNFRSAERAAITAFEGQMRRIASELTAERLPIAIDLARLPQSVRGFGHVKEGNRDESGKQERRLLEQFASGSTAEVRRAA